MTDRSVQERIAQLLFTGFHPVGIVETIAAIEREIVAPLVAAERERAAQRLDVMAESLRTSSLDEDLVGAVYLRLAARAIRATGGADA